MKINVNLKWCDCDGPHDLIVRGSNVHTSDCASNPVLIPCMVPRSVTFLFSLGECTCHAAMRAAVTGGERGRHCDDCPAKPLMVSCAVSGTTWKESEVVDAWPDNRPAPMDGAEHPEHVRACRARWALVKALVLGKPLSLIPGIPVGALRLVDQRDAVFSALVDVAQAEEVLYQRGNDALKLAIGNTYMRPDPADRESASTLARYVMHLIEQVGRLS